MSLQNSNYLAHRFTLLYLQYAENKKAFGYAEQEHEKTAIQLEGSIGCFAFSSLLSSIGPTIDLEQAKAFIYDYDSSMTGCLGLVDFLALYSDIPNLACMITSH